MLARTLTNSFTGMCKYVAGLCIDFLDMYIHMVQNSVCYICLVRPTLGSQVQEELYVVIGGLACKV